MKITVEKNTGPFAYANGWRSPNNDWTVYIECDSLRERHDVCDWIRFNLNHSYSVSYVEHCSLVIGIDSDDDLVRFKMVWG